MSDLLTPEIDPAVVTKRGETCIITQLRRMPTGVTMTVKAHPAVELFMRGLSDPEAPPVEVKVADRYWQPLTDMKGNVIGKPLLAYRFTAQLPPVLDEQGGPLFTLDRLARPLIDDVVEDGSIRSGGPPPVNLSFLRLIGISEGQGVSFDLKGVYSLHALQSLRDRISRAQYQFYVQYIRPVNLSVIVSTQEIQF